MAFISNYSSQHVSGISVKADGKCIRIMADGFWLTVNCAEAAQLIVDLRSAVEATPADAEQAA